MESNIPESQGPEDKPISEASPRDAGSPECPTSENEVGKKSSKIFERNGSLDANILDIEEAVYSSELILTYVAQEGIEVEKDILQTLVEARQKIEQGAISTDFEVNFWLAFNKLTNRIKPVTILSLKSSLGAYEFDRTGKKKKPLKSQKAVFKYGCMALITLFFLMGLQIYWIIGDNAVDGLSGFFEERAEIQDKLENLKYANRDQTNDFEYNRLNKAYKTVDQKLDAQYRLLLGWSKIWQNLLMIDDFELEISEYNRFKYKKKLESITNAMEDQEGQKDQKDQLLSTDKKSAAYRQLEESRSLVFQQLEEDKARQKMFLTIFSSRFVLDSLQQYFLPLFYGLLGAITFVLRTLNVQIRHHTYSHESEINFKLKLALGALAGMAIGWFLSSDSAVLNSFSPLALAFLFGYNVDVFFALMDQSVDKIRSFLKSKSESASSSPPSSS